MSEDKPPDSTVPSATSPTSYPIYSRENRYSRGGGRHRRGGWRRFNGRREEVIEPTPECLNLAELRSLPLEILQQRASELGVSQKLDHSDELIREMLKIHSKKQGLSLADGFLEMSRGGGGFLRSPLTNYQLNYEDAYISPAVVRRFSLQPGDWIIGMARPPRGRERHPTLVHTDLIWNEPSEKFQRRKSYEDLTPLHPDKRLVLETGSDSIAMRVLDLLAPLGRGQRCLIVAPPRAGKTVLLQQIAESIEKNDPDVDVLVLLLDERPEEVRNIKAVVKGEIVSSTFDENVERHVYMADLIMEKAHRMLENGRHVVLLLDSLTRLARACNVLSSPRGKLMSGGVEASALIKPRKFFSSARNIEEGGSLTIIATVLVETGSRMDDLIFEEFKGTGNMEIHLSRDLQERRIYPAIHIGKSGTRREELLYHPDEILRIQALRRQLSEYPPLEAIEKLIEMLKNTKSNAELLMRLKLT